MASETVEPSDGNSVLRTAPDHIVDMVLSLMRPPANAVDVDEARRRRYEARAWANRIWAEAAHAGAKWGLSHAPFKMQIDLSDAPLLGDLIREASPR